MQIILSIIIFFAFLSSTICSADNVPNVAFSKDSIVKLLEKYSQVRGLSLECDIGQGNVPGLKELFWIRQTVLISEMNFLISSMPKVGQPKWRWGILTQKSLYSFAASESRYLNFETGTIEIAPQYVWPKYSFPCPQNPALLPYAFLNYVGGSSSATSQINWCDINDFPELSKRLIDVTLNDKDLSLHSTYSSWDNGMNGDLCPMVVYFQKDSRTGYLIPSRTEWEDTTNNVLFTRNFRFQHEEITLSDHSRLTLPFLANSITVRNSDKVILEEVKVKITSNEPIENDELIIDPSFATQIIKRQSQ